MKVVMLYRPNSEQESPAIEFQDRMRRQTGHEIDMLSLDSPEGAAQASLYDIVDYPALLVIADDGSLQQFWQGKDQLPKIDDVLGYLVA